MYSVIKNSVLLNHWSLRDVAVYFENVIFENIVKSGVKTSFFKIAFRYIPVALIDDKSILVQAMAWCR